MKTDETRRIRQPVPAVERGLHQTPARREQHLRSGGMLGIASAPPIGAKGTVLRPELEQELQPIVAGHILRLQNELGLVEVPSSNYFLDSTGAIRPLVDRLAGVALTRDPEQQAEIDRRLTRAHGRHEMSFRVKNPATGAYDKIFEVPVNGTVVPLSESHFRMIVDSTGPVMRALRDLLQRYYANPMASAEELGLGALPPEDQKRVVETIRESIYFEPKLSGPAMRDYPFLAVGGFDASVGDLESPRPVFFEYNLGTPSGLSNNIQLLDILRQEDPKMFRALSDQLPEDQTFSILRRTIESNALSWTGNPDGISVVLSPGVYNGAHPDVASIALFSGMPLVNKSDLYTDNDGNVRLSTGKREDDPIVTGIYGRMEESFFFQDSKDGIPLRSPSYVETNAMLAKQYGFDLDPHVIYRYRYAESGQIFGLELDHHDRPQLQEVFDSIQSGSLAKAVLEKKLYYSGLGGRVVDDKRVFQAVSKYLAPSHVRGKEPIASPPRTLEPSQYDELYRSENLERYVVKEPDKSGGDGVMLLCNLPQSKRRETVDAVRRNPGRYIIQEFAQPAVMLAPEQQKDGSWAYSGSANDWRIFSMMDAGGNVDAGPQSVLLRAAKFYSASTNTSQGAGYGIGVVMKDHESPTRADSVLPEIPVQEFVGASRRGDLVQFLEKLLSMKGSIPRDGTASLLAQFQREAMDLLGRDFSPMMTIARSYDAGEIDGKTFAGHLDELRASLLSTDAFPAQGIELDVRRILSRDHPPLPRLDAEIRRVRELLRRPNGNELDQLLKQIITSSLAAKKTSYQEAVIQQKPVTALAIKHRDLFDQIFTTRDQDAFQRDGTLETLREAYQQAFVAVPKRRYAIH